MDFRLELGLGLTYVWAVPNEANGRLRLIAVGVATADDVEPTLLEDPFSVEYSESWSGELGTIGAHVVTNVQLYMTRGGYRCEARVRHEDGRLETYVLRYLV